MPRVNGVKLQSGGTAKHPNDVWDSILSGWAPTRGETFLRLYSDALNASLARAWLPRDDGQRILKTDLFDEAVGEGVYPALREQAQEVVGIDVSAAVVEAATARYPELVARQGDVRRLDLDDRSFDAVFSNSTLDHFASLEDAESALREFHRVLVPGGRLIVTLDNADNPLVAMRNALPGRFLRRSGLVPYPVGVTCGRRRLAQILIGSGFEVERLGAIMHVPRVLARAAARVGRPPGLLRIALAFERLADAPTRYLTGQFVAASARRA